jgi:hypothetical protein
VSNEPGTITQLKVQGEHLMKHKNRILVIAAFFGVVSLILSTIPLTASDMIKIVGKVNDVNQIIVDGEIFEVDDTPEGNDLVTNYISRKVEVTGKLRIEGDMRIIAVTEFKIVK